MHKTKRLFNTALGPTHYRALGGLDFQSKQIVELHKIQTICKLGTKFSV